MRSEYTLLTNQGAAIVAIAADDVENLAEFTAKQPAPFAFLSDSDRSVMKAYNVFNALSVEAFRIAHPSVFLIDPAGVVRWCFVGANQLEWPQTDKVAEHLAQLKAADV